MLASPACVESEVPMSWIMQGPVVTASAVPRGLQMVAWVVLWSANFSSHVHQLMNNVGLRLVRLQHVNNLVMKTAVPDLPHKPKGLGQACDE